jgi:hypothetical protein
MQHNEKLGQSVAIGCIDFVRQKILFNNCSKNEGYRKQNHSYSKKTGTEPQHNGLILLFTSDSSCYSNPKC